MKPLTVKMELFCTNYLGEAGGDATKAYRMSYDAKDMADSTVGSAAYRLLKSPRVQARLEELRKAVTAEIVFTAVDVLRRWVAIAEANPNDIVQNRHEACRFCHGINHEYQYTTKTEFHHATARAIDAGKPMPDAAGGFGFNANADPHPQCPECYGRGVERVWIADTRRLTGNAKLLYAGIKKTRDGVEVKLRDQCAALAHIAKYLGMLKNKVEFVPPASGTEIPPEVKKLTPILAGQAYQKFITGK